MDQLDFRKVHKAVWNHFIIAKLERQINKIYEALEICVTTIAEMNLTTKRMLFDLMGFVVNILRNALYIGAWIRDSLRIRGLTLANDCFQRQLQEGMESPIQHKSNYRI
ncbi:unnamed protein product [Brugia pahangi]|uniref:Uncharacterized protein n=1 Tax=Brugia pahangi TaxID=6280 RepID=A0A0N4T3F4_BRUPA|nr:unnamed protein product [Brugia pahangi]